MDEDDKVLLIPMITTVMTGLVSGMILVTVVISGCLKKKKPRPAESAGINPVSLHMSPVENGGSAVGINNTGSTVGPPVSVKKEEEKKPEELMLEKKEEKKKSDEKVIKEDKDKKLDKNDEKHEKTDKKEECDDNDGKSKKDEEKIKKDDDKDGSKKEDEEDDQYQQLNKANTPVKKDLLFKILVIGDVSTGKSSVVRRYVHNIFETYYKATIGVDFATKIVQWNDNRLVRLQFWDISGQDRFGNMTRVYYKDAHGALILTDCSRKATLEGALRWKADLDHKVCLANGRSVPAVLLANKCDLPSHVTDEDLQKVVDEHGFNRYFKVSAKSDIQIEESIMYLAEQVILTEDDDQYGQPVYLRDADTRRLSSATLEPEENSSSESRRNKMFGCC